MRLGRWAAVALLSGCAASDPPEVLVDWWPEAVVIEPVTWDQDEYEWVTVSVINQGYFDLTVSSVRAAGDGASNLEVAGGAEGQVLGLRDTANLLVRFRPPANDDTTLWSSQVFDQVSLSFVVSGYGVIDPSTGTADPSTLSSTTISVPITYSIDCDLDGDGYDANVCAGLDCNDDLLAINPGAVEVCDGVDNNCAGGVDEGCP